MNDDRWTKRLTDWHPYNDKLSKKVQIQDGGMRLKKIVGIAWQRISQNRQFWKELGKANVQPWNYKG